VEAVLHEPEDLRIPRIRPLKVRHRDVGFASLGEARWACVLTTLGLPWTYQPQGYDVGDGKGYLADFWITPWRAYVEIKPDGIDLEIAIAKCRAVARGSGKLVLLVVGAPGGDTYYVNTYGKVGDERLEIERGHFVECPRCDGYAILGELGVLEIGAHACRATERAALHTPTAAPRLFAAYHVARNLDPRTSR
jgi:hypothetical protein